MIEVHDFGAIELLYSLRNIDKDIKEQLDILEQLKSIVTSVTVATDKEAVQSSGSKDKMAVVISKIVDLENEINNKKHNLASRKELTKNIIFSIEKEKYRNVLYDYFICNLPLWRVSENTEIPYDNAHKILKRAEKTFKKLYDQKIQDNT